jgi:hypothetical protein
MILNLTQHKATPDQIDAGVIDLPEEERAELQRLLTFDTVPDSYEIADRADAIASFARKMTSGVFSQAMIGGAPYLMSSLEWYLKGAGIEPVYAFSVRESVEEIAPDGSVRKVNVFKHAGFIQV